jgi:hypothetical protein
LAKKLFPIAKNLGEKFILFKNILKNMKLTIATLCFFFPHFYPNPQ